MKTKKLLQSLLFTPGKKLTLKKDFDSSYTPPDFDAKEAGELLKDSVERMAEQQEKLYAQDTFALLIVLQAMDAAGKDGLVKHVMTGLNPQGCQVYSFKAPSTEELDHDYLWRCSKVLPERGRIGIFNRSYYEEVLVARVHPEILDRQKLPPHLKGGRIFQRRFEEIRNFERYLVDNGIVVLKLFLHVSKEEQRRRFLARIDRPEKNWKFSVADVRERGFWDDYQKAYQDCLRETSTDWAPWYVIPADSKPFARIAAARVISETLRSLNLAYPSLGPDQQERLIEVRAMLEAEPD